MFQKANKQLFNLLTNPSKVIREQEEVEDALIYTFSALKNIANISKQKENYVEIVERPVERIIQVPIKYKEEEELLFTDEEIIQKDVNSNLATYQTFFDNCKKNLESLLDSFINDKDKLLKTPTIGSNSFDMYKDYDDAEKQGVPKYTNYSQDDVFDSKDSITIDYENKRSFMTITTDMITNNFLVDFIGKHAEFLKNC
jgi:hypothetical protein